MFRVLRVALVCYMIRHVLYALSKTINVAFISRTLGYILEVCA